MGHFSHSARCCWREVSYWTNVFRKHGQGPHLGPSSNAGTWSRYQRPQRIASRLSLLVFPPSLFPLATRFYRGFSHSKRREENNSYDPKMEKRSWMMLPEVVTPESESQWYKHHHHQHHPTPSASLPQVVVTEEQDISPVSTASPVYSPQAARGQLFPPPMQTMRKKELLPEPKRKKEPMHTRSFIITVLVAWIVILAVGLGAGLGIGLQRPSTPAAAADAGPGGGGGGAAVMHGGNGSAAPIEVTRGTGLATVVRADGEGMLLYYQNAAGEVVEEFWTNSSLAEDLLSVSDANKAPVARGRSVVQTPEVVQGSVLAAVSFMLNGNVWVSRRERRSRGLD